MVSVQPAVGYLLDEARVLAPRVVRLRRRLHQHPEIGLDLPATRRAVLDEIADLDLATRTSTTTSSVVATLEGGRPGPTVILRGDMDALPLQEDTGLEFASRVPGVMHACGHDMHTAMLAGAARLLVARRHQLAGRVHFLFQAGEEGFHGARYVLEEGLLDGDDIAGAFALHVSPSYESGTVNVRNGPLLAAADAFRVVLRGRGGHASAPHLANDPVPVACEIVTALQVALSRRISAFEPAVLTVARIAAGDAHNVIPASAELEGTTRMLSDAVRDEVRHLLRRVCAGVAAAHEMDADVEISAGYPVTVNDASFTGIVREVVGAVLGADRVVDLDEPVMGAEDFAYVLARYTGAMAFLGACPPGVDPDDAPPNHSNRVVFDESAMTAGMAVLAGVALDGLGTKNRLDAP